MDQVFRSAPEPSQPKTDVPDVEVNKDHVISGESDIEPIAVREENGGSIVLDALNISDTINVLPQDDKAKVEDVKHYVLKIMESKGLGETVGAFKKVLNEVKGEMGLDQEAEPSIVLDRIAGVVRAWKNLSFISDPQEKKSIFMKLANMKSSADMNKEVYRLMNKYEVWR
jgi:hypothetical protein